MAMLAAGVVSCLPPCHASDEDSGKRPEVRPTASNSSPTKASSTKDEEDRDVPELNLLDAMKKGAVSVKAEGNGDGRMIVSVTNRTNRPLRVVLPPGIVAQGATGQMGGMGGMGGGGMGGMGGGMGGMGGGGMGGMGGGGMGGGGMGGRMGGMGRSSGTLPPMMGMMMLANIIMYFTGDYDSWDRRSLMVGMGRMGGMGGMGGGMGGMGGGMGGMGGGMRSVPPSSLPFANLKPGQTRNLPTRLVSLTPPDLQGGLRLPAKGEALQLGDIGEISTDPRVQKAMKRLADAHGLLARLAIGDVAIGRGPGLGDDRPVITGLGQSL